MDQDPFVHYSSNLKIDGFLDKTRVILHMIPRI